jgi:UPF0148 protein|tara:strand:+ start:129 stop:449 length:321 start_codon:yes stop_codon:yes gene_type:complete
MSKGLTKKAVDMLLGGATLLSEPCPYCKGVRVMKDGNALCINCGREPEHKTLETNSTSSDKPTLEKLEKKLSDLTDELSNEESHEKQQLILKSINLLIETIEKLKR